MHTCVYMHVTDKSFVFINIKSQEKKKKKKTFCLTEREKEICDVPLETVHEEESIIWRERKKERKE